MRAVTAALARTQVRLARLELDGKNYKAAIAEAEATLELQEGHEEATQILSEARSKLTELEGVAFDAQSKFDAGDTAGATAALRKLLELDPAHPLATELTGELNQHFRTQAEDARAAMTTSRQQAEPKGAMSDAAFTVAAAVAARGESALRTRSRSHGVEHKRRRLRRAPDLNAPATVGGSRGRGRESAPDGGEKETLLSSRRRPGSSRLRSDPSLTVA